MLARCRKHPIRRGAAMVEAAFVLPVFLSLCLGMIDLGIAVFQNNAIVEASRQGARIASVHGAYAADDGSGTVWGPAADLLVAGNSTTDPIVVAIRGAGALAGLNTANVTISLSWPTGTNSVANGDTVQVKVSTLWSPVIFYVFGNKSVTLTATSIMPIAH
jgi:Flp pilus assembly protein TadG